MQKQSPDVYYKKTVVKKWQYLQKNTSDIVSLFNSEYCEIFKNTYFEDLWTAASEYVFNKLRENKNRS